MKSEILEGSMRSALARMRSASQCPQRPCNVPMPPKKSRRRILLKDEHLCQCPAAGHHHADNDCDASRQRRLSSEHIWNWHPLLPLGWTAVTMPLQTGPPRYAEDGRITTLTHAVRRPNRTEPLQIYNSLCLKTWQNQNVLSINYSGAIRAAERRLGQRFPHSVSGPWLLAIKMHLGFKAGEEHLSLGTNLPRQILRAKPICLLPLCRWLLWKKKKKISVNWIPRLPLPLEKSGFRSLDCFWNEEKS